MSQSEHEYKKYFWFFTSYKMYNLIMLTHLISVQKSIPVSNTHSTF